MAPWPTLVSSWLHPENGLQSRVFNPRRGEMKICSNQSFFFLFQKGIKLYFFLREGEDKYEMKIAGSVAVSDAKNEYISTDLMRDNRMSGVSVSFLLMRSWMAAKPPCKSRE